MTEEEYIEMCVERAKEEAEQKLVEIKGEKDD